MDKHLLLALFIPVLFLVFTGLIKTLVKKEFLWSNFYLGLDIAFAAMANGVVNIVDISHDLEQHPGTQGSLFSDRILNNALFLLLAFGTLLFDMFLHQRWEDIQSINPTGNYRVSRGIWLGIISNMIGGGVLLTFILYRLKGLL